LKIGVTSDDHIKGPRNASVTLVEYGDYQCPVCGAAFWVLRDLFDRFQPDLRFVFRNFPLTEIHPHAMIAAEAAEAAGARGKFWPMHDLIFENQQDLSAEQLVAYAVSLDLDGDELMKDLSTHRHVEKIRRDFMGGVRSGVNGTPTIFINGYRFNGLADYDVLARAIDEARAGQYAAQA
jgi:protein-disulfide isomerase